MYGGPTGPNYNSRPIGSILFISVCQFNSFCSILSFIILIESIIIIGDRSILVFRLSNRSAVSLLKPWQRLPFLSLTHTHTRAHGKQQQVKNPKPLFFLLGFVYCSCLLPALADNLLGKI